MVVKRPATCDDLLMCGVAGHVGPGTNDAYEQTVRRMVQTLVRRGPDSEGVAKWPNAVLGHRRLAILDLSAAGHQPMLSDDGQIGLVFNGCIFNFLELRQELEQRGHQFRSRSDTEVLLRGYEEWGIDALAGRLRGMFAFGIWDQRRRTLTLVRDRLGVKPLMYCERNGEIGFASTVRALRAAGFGGEINPDAVIDLLEFGWVRDSRAIYTGICKLPPATILEWQDGRVSERQYWWLPAGGEAPRTTFQEAVEETERLLLESVRLRLISDVPIGVLLSGGIDSALVCWAMREANANITAFTVRAPGDASDESVDAAYTARVLDIPHEIVEMPNTSFSPDELVDAYCEAFSCQSALAVLWVARAVKRRATVLLTGDGGDDVFFGYPFFRNAWLAQRVARRLPAPAAAAWRVARKACPPYGAIRRMRHFMDYATGGLGDHARAHDGLPYYECRSILGERLRGMELPERQTASASESGRRLLQEVSDYHRRMHFTSEFLPKLDGGTMYHSIEGREPLLDSKLWEFGAALPPEIHFHGRRLKAVLREIARRRIGPEVAYREKRGFTVPIEQWLAGRWSEMLDHLREGTLLEKEGWVKPGALREPLKTALAEGRVPIQLWRLVVLEFWMKSRLRERG